MTQPMTDSSGLWFNDAELQRAKDKLLNRYQKAVEAAPTRKNSELVQPLLNNFFDNLPYMTPELELEFVQYLCTMLDTQALNQLVAQIMPAENIVITYQGPEKEGLVNPDRKSVV